MHDHTELLQKVKLAAVIQIEPPQGVALLKAINDWTDIHKTETQKILNNLVQWNKDGIKQKEKVQKQIQAPALSRLAEKPALLDATNTEQPEVSLHENLYKEFMLPLSDMISTQQKVQIEEVKSLPPVSPKPTTPRPANNAVVNDPEAV